MLRNYAQTTHKLPELIYFATKLMLATVYSLVQTSISSSIGFPVMVTAEGISEFRLVQRRPYVERCNTTYKPPRCFLVVRGTGVTQAMRLP